MGQPGACVCARLRPRSSAAPARLCVPWRGGRQPGAFVCTAFETGAAVVPRCPSGDREQLGVERQRGCGRDDHQTVGLPGRVPLHGNHAGGWCARRAAARASTWPPRSTGMRLVPARGHDGRRNHALHRACAGRGVVLVAAAAAHGAAQARHRAGRHRAAVRRARGERGRAGGGRADGGSHTTCARDWRRPFPVCTFCCLLWIPCEQQQQHLWAAVQVHLPPFGHGRAAKPAGGAARRPWAQQQPVHAVQAQSSSRACVQRAPAPRLLASGGCPCCAAATRHQQRHQQLGAAAAAAADAW